MTQQTILSLTANILPSIKSMGISEAVHNQWKKACLGVISQNLNIQHEEKRLIELLSNNNIPFVVIKGSSAAVYYCHPEYRTAGDIDIFVRPQSIEQVRILLDKEKYELIEDFTEDLRHITYIHRNTTIEIHQRFFTIDDGETVKEDVDLYEALEKRAIKPFRDYSVPVFLEVDNGLLLLQHMRQHLRSGMGLRQLIDWAMYVNTICDDHFWNNGFRDAVESAGLYNLALCSTHLIKKYLWVNEKITWCNEADDSLCEDLLEYIISKGNFGHKRSEQSDKVAVVLSHNMNLKEWLCYLQKQGCEHWRFAQKHKGFKGIAWLYQLFRYLALGVKEICTSSIGRQYKMSKNRKNMFDKLNIPV